MSVQPKRRYELKRRAEKQEETRQRITEATVELHESVGAAHTTIKAIAERAGVERLTVYRHFPDERSLLGACSAHWSAAHPPPDPAAWAGVTDPSERLNVALAELYAYYERNERMIANNLRDAPAMPVLAELMAAWGEYAEACVEVLARGWGVRGANARRLRETLAHALDFETWRGLCRRQALAPAEAVRLASGWV